MPKKGKVSKTKLCVGPRPRHIMQRGNNITGDCKQVLEGLCRIPGLREKLEENTYYVKPFIYIYTINCLKVVDLALRSAQGLKELTLEVVIESF